MTTAVATPIANGTAVPSAETIAAVSPNVWSGPVNTKVKIRAIINLTPGTTTTAVVAKIYRGGVIAAGNLIATATLTLAAANSGTVTVEVEDSIAFTNTDAGGVYSVSLTQTAGTANGTVNAGELTVELLP